MAISLSCNEQMILEAIWNAGRPLSRGEILEAVEGKSDWNPASIHLVLNSMVKKGAIAVEDASVHYGRHYRAELTKKDYIARYAQNVCVGETEQQRLLEITAAMIVQPGADETTLSTMERLIQSRRAELEEARH